MQGLGILYPSINTYFSLDATHIFDGLNDFPTHVAHMRFGSFVTLPTPWTPNPSDGTISNTSNLYKVALQWLKEDRDFRRELEKEGKRIVRGARRNEVGVWAIADHGNFSETVSPILRLFPPTRRLSTESKV